MLTKEIEKNYLKIREILELEILYQVTDHNVGSLNFATQLANDRSINGSRSID